MSVFWCFFYIVWFNSNKRFNLTSLQIFTKNIWNEIYILNLDYKYFLSMMFYFIIYKKIEHYNQRLKANSSTKIFVPIFSCKFLNFYGFRFFFVFLKKAKNHHSRNMTVRRNIWRQLSSCNWQRRELRGGGS